MKIRGVGFDLGETLIFYRDTPLNWAALYPEALRAAAEACGISATPE
jgi:putative hydrolase of the HAD superfamily